MIGVRHLPLGLLLAYGVGFAAAGFGWSVPAFDDHPGQLYRLWHVVNRGPAPWAWNPDWWAGYPELQFYPPGFFYLGALLHGLLALGPGHGAALQTAYRALLWLTYLAPGVTTYALLARLLGGGWTALPGAFLALTLSAGVASGVEGGVHVGMLPARLGWALLPLLALVVVDGGEPARDRAWISAPLVAVIALVHPAHLPAAVALLGLAACSAAGARGRRLREAATVVGVAGGLTLFWSLPLAARIAEARALAWGSLPAPSTLVAHPLLIVLLMLAAAAPRLARSRGERVAGLWPWTMIAVVAAVGFAEGLGVRWLPAARVADSAWLAVVIAAGLALGRLTEAAAAAARAPGPLVVLAAVAGLVVASLPGRTLALWTRSGQWPALGTFERELGLDELWGALRAAPPGRVLFVRSGVPLQPGTAWWRPHSHVTALTPLATAAPPALSGRQIVHGTFTHPSPIAALLYRGPAGRGAIRRLAEETDGVSLFGRRLEDIDVGAWERWTDRLGVGLIVALEEDAPRLRVLDDGPAFERRARVGRFVIFARRTPPPLAEPLEAGRWRLVLPATPTGWVSTRLAYYPLWRAERDGVSVPTGRGEMGDLVVAHDGAGAAVELVYAAGTVEHLGVLGSLAAAAAWAALWARAAAVRRARRQRSADSRTEARATPAAS